jgi:hypothetical protein
MFNPSDVTQFVVQLFVPLVGGGLREQVFGLKAGERVLIWGVGA